MNEQKIVIKKINKEIDLREKFYADSNHTAIIVEGLKIARTIIEKEDMEKRDKKLKNGEKNG